MRWKDAAEPVLPWIPVVARPEGHVPFRRKPGWTGGILVLYFFLMNVTLSGLDAATANDLFGQFRSILAGQRGSVLQLGIGPIVTVSIVPQLLGGADLLGLDTNNGPHDQVLYQGLQKLLVGVMICLTGLSMVFAGNFLSADQAIATSLGTDTIGVKGLIFVQIAVGGVLTLFMDEIVSKWGIGSGVGLFIIAGVSQQLAGGLFSWQGLGGTSGFFATWTGIITDAIELPASPTDLPSTVFFGQGQLLAFITTLLIFGIVVYAGSVRVKIPPSHARMKGIHGRFPVKLIYASVLPMILVRALQANTQFLGRFLNSSWVGMPTWLGQYTSGQVTDGLLYYLAPVQSRPGWMWFLGLASADPLDIAIRVLINLILMIVGDTVFAIFWVETAGMDLKSTTQQIQNSGMQIPGFRRSLQVIERVMERYIPQMTATDSALVGLLAVTANMLDTIGAVSGTGSFLTVSITYKLYEEIVEEQLMEMHPMIRNMLGSE